MFRKDNFNEARRITHPTNMDSDVVRAAQAILKGKDGIETTHIENALLKLIDQTAALAEDMSGEARLRVLMGQRCLLDAQEEFIRQEDKEDA